MNYILKKDDKHLKYLIGRTIGNPFLKFDVLKDYDPDASFILYHIEDNAQIILFNDPNSNKFGTINYEASYLKSKEEINELKINKKEVYHNYSNPIITYDGIFAEFEECYLNEIENCAHHNELNEKLKNPLLWLKSKVDYENFDLIIEF